MKKIIISMAFAATLFVSCNNENLGTSPTADNSMVTKDGSMYKISELPLVPEFAKPIEKTGEIRKFTLIKNDGSKLNFELTSIKATLFGKMRTLIGSVNTNEQTKEKAIMIVGENGFELFYTDHQQNFKLQGKDPLNIGYKNAEFNLPGTLKEKFLAYASKKGVEGNQLLKSLNKKIVEKDNDYDKIVENSSYYNLINQTVSLQQRGKNYGEQKCGSGILPTHPVEKKYDEKMSSAYKAYNIEIMYMQDTYAFTESYNGLLQSLYSVDTEFETNSSLQPNISQYLAPILPEDYQDTAAIDAYFDYWYAFPKVSEHQAQLDNMHAYTKNHPSTISGRVVRCALYEDVWDVAGAAYEDQYAKSTWSSYSILVSSDDYDSTFAHECGHNLGAGHASSVFDVMYPTKSIFSNYDKHYDTTNISKIKASLTY
ncbi:zinc-dependent metalloprotease family protein [Chryseobacterium sp.]|uniref:zinc-dependent metalloprotease family protein n=1 Tax=Chryseobacterium sp. TaxID=1871047 RepID=UPI002FC87CC5